MAKVDNALRRFVAVGIGTAALAIFGMGASGIWSSSGNVGFKIIILIMLFLVSCLVLVPAYWFWCKRDRELVMLGAFLASLALFFFLLSLPRRIGLHQWFSLRLNDPSTNPYVDLVIGLGLIYVCLVFPFQAAHWSYRKISSLANRWLNHVASTSVKPNG
jgi:hypothetical protein